ARRPVRPSRADALEAKAPDDAVAAIFYPESTCRFLGFGAVEPAAEGAARIFIHRMGRMGGAHHLRNAMEDVPQDAALEPDVLQGLGAAAVGHHMEIADTALDADVREVR